MLNKKWIFVAAIFLLGSTISYARSPLVNLRCVLLGPTPSLIVKFGHTKSSIKPDLSQRFLQTLKTKEARFTSGTPIANDAYILYFTPSKTLQTLQTIPGCYDPETIDTLIKHLKQKSDIISASPNRLMTINEINKSQLLPVVGPKQWALKSWPGGIDAETAYNTTTGNYNAVVAVLDTGITTNLSLVPTVRSGVTFNNNGSYHVGAAPSCGAECPGYDHGTHVIGTVAASGALAYGETIYGVAPTANAIPVNVFTKITNPLCVIIYGTPSCLTATNADIINALAWLNGTTFAGLPAAPYIVSANMSLGGFGACGADTQNAFNALLAKNISFAISAGNDNANAADYSPANCTGVMTIAATGPDGNGSFYTNYGAIVDFAAPGGSNSGSPPDTQADEIYSTIENGYGYSQGTSMASPHVAGLTALMYTLDPTLTPTLVNSLIAANTNPFPGSGTYPNCENVGQPCGTGVINANATVLATVAQAPTLDWGVPNLVATPTDTTALLEWDAATWSAPRSTAIAYTAYVNGVAHADCTSVTTTSCRVRHLTRGTAYSAIVKATDIRGIYQPIQQSNTVNFTTTNTLTGVTITKAARNPLLTSQAFAYYSSLSNVPADYYTVDGLPNGATVEIDTENRRFIISTILTPRKVTNVTILANIGVDAVPSNSFTVPNIL